MGAEVFYVSAKGANKHEAFNTAVSEAYWQHGHDGYTGTIAEKGEFVMIALPEGEDPYDYAMKLIDAEDRRIDDKWGPAGCFDLGNGEFVFFGWASS